MDGAEATKTVSESRVVLAQHMGVSDSNLAGAVHGGTIMKMVDTAGALAAMKFAGKPVVTAAIDELSFLEPVNLGDLVTVTASVNGVGSTSMEVGVRVETEDVLTGERRHTSTAYVLYVALDPETRQPVTVPRLVAETTEERRRQRQARARRKARLARREATLAARQAADEAARQRKEAAEARRQARLAAKETAEELAAAKAKAASAKPRADSPPPEPPDGDDLRRWRNRRSEPALVGASSEAVDPASDLTRWRRRNQ
ncbi:MAG TPA: acyl-CoA thioesterase [Actinomycetota bacterium]|nr:acyl-CoA thioesterase [Actinomycetota bacterium]